VEVVALWTARQVPPVDAIPLLARREQLRDLAPLDFIDICTPTASHLELTLWGLEQGYHVVCEKPVPSPAASGPHRRRRGPAGAS